MIESTQDSQALYEMPDVMTDKDWLDVAKRAYADSDTYLDTGLRKRFERNYALALSRHPSGSKYYTDSYKHRSKVFRGKTAAAIRRNLSACAVALFSTQDVVSIQAEDDSKPEQVLSAKACDLLQNYHLTESIPWYRTVVGAYREAQTVGVVCSKQWWKYETVEVEGEEITVQDVPCVELIPIENIRISPAADWLNPIDTSPYTILVTPMYVGDIKERMKLDWLEATDDEISHAMNDDEYDSIRGERESNKPDSKAEKVSVKDQDLGWVREVFVNHKGVWMHYYTLGDSVLLSEPQMVIESYPHCKDNRPPLRWGVAEVEPHVVYPQSMVERVEGTQIQANEIANQRFDNVQQVLNTRKIVKRGANVDYRSLLKNVPGAVTLADDVSAVQELPGKDVTASAYNEQNMINMDFDELSGTFSTASVATNRQLNETVGGMQLLSGNSNVQTEFTLRTFVESWVEPVMRDMVEMIKTYEENDRIQKVTGMPISHYDLQQPVVVRVNVGFGATDPTMKVNKLMFGMEMLRRILADPNMKSLGLNPEEIGSEIMGAIGYKDATRFIPGLKTDEDPQVKALKQQIQELQQQLQNDTAKTAMQKEIEQLKAQNDIQVEQMRMQDNAEERRVRERLAQLDLQKEAAKLAQQEGVEVKKILAMLSGKEMDNKARAEVQQRKQADDLKAKLHTMKIMPEKSSGHWPG